MSAGLYSVGLVPRGLDDVTAAAGGYTLTCAQGSYTLSGQTVGLLSLLTVFATQGSYTLTGNAAGLRPGKVLTLAQGAYTLTGSAASVDYALTLAAGSYSLSGQELALTYSGGNDYTISLDAGSYSLTGQSVTLSGPPEPEPETVQRRGGSRFALARKALLKRQLIEWLTKEEPSEEVKKAIQEVKAGVPVETTETPKLEPKIDPEELAKKLIPRRLIGLEDILTRSQLRIVRRAAQIAQERDDEDILMLL